MLKKFFGLNWLLALFSAGIIILLGGSSLATSWELNKGWLALLNGRLSAAAGDQEGELFQFLEFSSRKSGSEGAELEVLLLRLQPGSLRHRLALAQSANVYAEAGEIQKAARYWGKARAFVALAHAGRRRFEAKDFSMAEVYWSTLAELLRPDDSLTVQESEAVSVSLRDLSVLYSRRRDFAKAAETWISRSNFQESNSRFDLRAGILLFLAGDLEASRKWLEQIDQGSTEGASAELYLGQIALLQGSPEAAVEHLNRAVELRPEANQGWYHLGMALHQAGQSESAKQAFERIPPESDYGRRARRQLEKLGEGSSGRE